MSLTGLLAITILSVYLQVAAPAKINSFSDINRSNDENISFNTIIELASKQLSAKELIKFLLKLLQVYTSKNIDFKDNGDFDKTVFMTESIKTKPNTSDKKEDTIQQINSPTKTSIDPKTLSFENDNNQPVIDFNMNKHIRKKPEKVGPDRNSQQHPQMPSDTVPLQVKDLNTSNETVTEWNNKPINLSERMNTEINKLSIKTPKHYPNIKTEVNNDIFIEPNSDEVKTSAPTTRTTVNLAMSIATNDSESSNKTKDQFPETISYAELNSSATVKQNKPFEELNLIKPIVSSSKYPANLGTETKKYEINDASERDAQVDEIMDVTTDSNLSLTTMESNGQMSESSLITNYNLDMKKVSDETNYVGNLTTDVKNTTSDSDLTVPVNTKLNNSTTESNLNEAITEYLVNSNSDIVTEETNVNKQLNVRTPTHQYETATDNNLSDTNFIKLDTEVNIPSWILSNQNQVDTPQTMILVTMVDVHLE